MPPRRCRLRRGTESSGELVVALQRDDGLAVLGFGELGRARFSSRRRPLSPAPRSRPRANTARISRLGSCRTACLRAFLASVRRPRRCRPRVPRAPGPSLVMAKTWLCVDVSVDDARTSWRPGVDRLAPAVGARPTTPDVDSVTTQGSSGSLVYVEMSTSSIRGRRRSHDLGCGGRRRRPRRSLSVR